MNNLKIADSASWNLISMRGLDGWLTCDFTSFPIVFQSYQDDGRLIMKGCVQWKSVYG